MATRSLSFAFQKVAIQHKVWLLLGELTLNRLKCWWQSSQRCVLSTWVCSCTGRGLLRLGRPRVLWADSMQFSSPCLPSSLSFPSPSHQGLSTESQVLLKSVRSPPAAAPQARQTFTHHAHSLPPLLGRALLQRPWLGIRPPGQILPPVGPQWDGPLSALDCCAGALLSSFDCPVRCESQEIEKRGDPCHRDTDVTLF